MVRHEIDNVGWQSAQGRIMRVLCARQVLFEIIYHTIRQLMRNEFQVK